MTMTYNVCDGRPEELARAVLCLDELSKDVKGQLCGRVNRAKDPAMRGLQLTAAYPFAFEPDEKGGQGGLAGTVEGVVVRTCDTTKDCLSFAAVGSAANPRVVGPLTIETGDT